MIKLIQLQRQVIGDELKKAKLKAKREDMKLLIEEMSRLSQLNDKLQFAEESVDRLQIVLREQQIPNLDLSPHLSGAKEEVSKLKVDNDTNAVEVKENQKALDSMEDLKSERKKALKQLEYDVNVIEKEGRKLAKEYQKVMEIKIDDLGPILDQEDIEASDEEIYTLLNRSSTSGHSSELETVSSPPIISSISKDIHEENNENNSDTGLSSLHTSSDEGGTCEVGTLV